MKIAVNQVGYASDAAKVAYFEGFSVNEPFEVASHGKVVFVGKIERAVDNRAGGEITCLGNFSEFKEPGEYVIRACGVSSYPFCISPKAYEKLNCALANMLYTARCGCSLSAERGGAFAHAACHTGKAKIYGSDEYLSVTGGWHDAGDYGRYAVPAAKVIADLLLCDNESYLAEAKFGLEFLIKLQREDGGVYHKLTCARFPDLACPPENETEQLILSPVSTAATADFCAVAAMGSMYFNRSDAPFAVRLLSAARLAYGYLQSHEAKPFKNADGISTGEYPDEYLSDELFWAACAMYAATGKDEYHQKIKSASSLSLKDDFGWEDVALYGRYLYLTLPRERTDEACFRTNADRVLQLADRYVAQSKKDGYNISVGENYRWGSNMYIANNGILLCLANRLSPKDDYLYYAQTHLNFILGANPLNICYVTGFGAKFPSHPHHRPSVAAKQAMRGMLVGGASVGLQGDYAAYVLGGSPAARCYVDNEQSYSTNEVCVYWNSALMLLTALTDVKK